jgi:osmotically-inducible protein OsmY
MKSDSQLQHDLMAELQWDPCVNPAHIGVAVKNGIVSLSAHVSNYTEKLAAEKAARRVKEVRGLAEEIEVRFPSDPKTTDAEIARRILDLFEWDVTIPREQVSVKVENGWVTLTGTVDAHYQREGARKAAGRVGGVKGVSNLIELRSVPSPTDIRERIRAALERHAGLDANSITIVADGNTVRLGGRVSDWRERDIAERAAWAAPDVTRIEDNIVFL